MGPVCGACTEVRRDSLVSRTSQPFTLCEGDPSVPVPHFSGRTCEDWRGLCCPWMGNILQLVGPALDQGAGYSELSWCPAG